MDSKSAIYKVDTLRSHGCDLSVNRQLLQESEYFTDRIEQRLRRFRQQIRCDDRRLGSFDVSMVLDKPSSEALIEQYERIFQGKVLVAF